MTIAEQHGTTYFQLSTIGVGALAIGLSDIRQRINNVLTCIPGTDPLRPLFGSYAYLYADKPLATSIPNIKKEIFNALSTWMPEILVNSITHTIISAGNVAFNINYSLIDSDLIDTITYQNGLISGGNTGNSIILTAVVPAQVSGGIYRVAFIVNGNQVFPLIPVQGFATATDMLTWINTNWANYGRWYLNGKSLVLYLNSGLANTATLTVTETASITLSNQIPVLTLGKHYNVTFTIGGNAPATPFPNGTLTTIGSLLIWVQANWGQYGNWSITAVSSNPTIADFTSDFSGDFDIITQLTTYYLVFQTTGYLSATLAISHD